MPTRGRPVAVQRLHRPKQPLELWRCRPEIRTKIQHPVLRDAERERLLAPSCRQSPAAPPASPRSSRQDTWQAWSVSARQRYRCAEASEIAHRSHAQPAPSAQCARERPAPHQGGADRQVSIQLSVWSCAIGQHPAVPPDREWHEPRESDRCAAVQPQPGNSAPRRPKRNSAVGATGSSHCFDSLSPTTIPFKRNAGQQYGARRPSTDPERARLSQALAFSNTLFLEAALRARGIRASRHAFNRSLPHPSRTASFTGTVNIIGVAEAIHKRCLLIQA